MKSKLAVLLALCLSFLFISSCGKTSLEGMISKVLKDPEVKTYFEEVDLIVIIDNEICNPETLDLTKIKSEKEIWLLNKEAAYMRLMDKTMEVLEIKELPGNKNKLKLKLQNFKTLTFEF